MKFSPKSIRSFIGAKDFHISKQFYTELGFTEAFSSDDMSYFEMSGFGFYLQDYYVKKWVNNSMLFLEVSDLDAHFEAIKKLELDKKYKNVRLTEIVKNDWGNEFFMHDPSGVLWHIGEFNVG